MAVLALPFVLLKSARVPSAVLPLALPPSGGGVPASEETNKNKPVIITMTVKTVRRYLLGVVPSKIPCTAVVFRVLYVRGLSAMAPLPGGFISRLVLRKRRNEVIETRKVFRRGFH